MTEMMWLKSTNPGAMLQFLGNQATDRKLRLFACACCRRAWGFAKRSIRLNKILPVVEDFADGNVKERAREKAYRLSAAVAGLPMTNPQGCFGWELMGVSAKVLQRSDYQFGEWVAAAFGLATGDQSKHKATRRAERKKQTSLVREIFGNPFRPVPFSTKWRTSTAMTLAKQMYDSREFTAMPILADALQDADCDSEAILNHLRDPHATHVRGCWALDLVLGKE